MSSIHAASFSEVSSFFPDYYVRFFFFHPSVFSFLRIFSWQNFTSANAFPFSQAISFGCSSRNFLGRSSFQCLHQTARTTLSCFFFCSSKSCPVSFFDFFPLTLPPPVFKLGRRSSWTYSVVTELFPVSFLRSSLDICVRPFFPQI